MSLWKRWMGLLVLVLVAGCVKSGIRPSSPWKEEYRPFFDDCVETVGDVSRLQGHWAEEQKKQLEGRAYFGDFIAKVNLLSIHTVTDAEGRQSKIVTVKIFSTLYGEAPEETLELTSREDQPGYGQLERYEKENQSESPFMLFVKWYEEKDQILFHYHLQAMDAAVEIIVETMVDKRKSEESKSRERRQRQ